jgi:protease-4
MAVCPGARRPAAPSIEESPVSKSFKWFLVFVALALVLVVVGVVALFWLSWRQHRVPQRTVIEIDFADPIQEVVADDPFAELFAQDRMRLRDVVEGLRLAGEDDKVVGLVADLSHVQLGFAQIEEVREAVTAFRRSGKPAIAYADSFGEVTPANGAYYLASAFDEIYIQPSGDVGFTGLQLTSTFLRGTLDKIGVTPEFAQRHEYKNAMNTFTETAFTPAHREAMDTLAGSIYENMLTAVARGRELETDALRAAVDAGPLLGEQAVEAGLVDGLRYRDQVLDGLREGIAGKGEPDLLYLHRYWRRVERPRGDRVVAVVYGVGSVVRGESQTDLFGGSVMGSQTVAAALRAASEDDDVAAIVLRVDSPGGSYVASDTIWREVTRARERGKPVIVSMGDLAASGGYFVAAPATKIVAHPSTITGSIGVLGGKMVTTEMWGKLGITFDSVQRGEHAEMWSTAEGFDPDEWSKFNAWLDRVYEDFTGKVAEGRGLPIERVREIAKGRVWSGVDAKRLGLVDELGGWETALRVARREAGLDEDATVTLREYPRARSPFEELFGPEPESSEDEGTESAAGLTGVLRGLRALRALRALEPLLRELHAAGLLEQQQPAALRMPPVEAR